MIADTSTAATSASVASQAVAVLVAMVNGNLDRAQIAILAVHNTVANGLTGAGAAVLSLAGIASSGSQSIDTAVGAEFAALIHAGTIVLSSIHLMADQVTAGRLSATAAVFTLAIADLSLPGADSQQKTQLLTNIAGLIQTGAIGAKAAFDQLVAAGSALHKPIADTIDDVISVPAGAAGALAAGEELVSLITSNAITLPAVLALLQSRPDGIKVNILIGMSQSAVASNALKGDVYTALFAAGTPTFTADAASRLITSGGFTVGAAIDALAQLALRGPAGYLTAVGAKLTSLLNDGTITAADLNDRLNGLDSINSVRILTPEQAFLVLAAAVDPNFITAQNLLLVPISNVGNGLAATIVAAAEASELSGAQIVAAIAEKRGGEEFVNQLAGLIQRGRVTETQAYTAMANVLPALAPTYQTILGTSIVYLGYALGNSGAGLLAKVTAGNQVLSQAQLVTVFIRLLAAQTASIAQSSDAYPRLGLDVGAAILSHLGSPLTLAQALSIVVGDTALDPANKSLTLIGIARAGAPDQQIAAGQALADLLDTGATLEITGVSSSYFLTQWMSADRVVRLLAGAAIDGAPATKTVIGSMFAALDQLVNGVSSSFMPFDTVIGTIDSAVNSGYIRPGDAAKVLAVIGGGAIIQADFQSVRGALDVELTALVSSGRLSVADAVNALAPQASQGPLALQNVTGRLIAALQAAGLATSASLITLVDANLTSSAITPTAAVAIYAGAAMVNTGGFAWPLGNKIGAMIEAGLISVADAINTIKAVDANSDLRNGLGEVALLVAAAGHIAAGLQTASGGTGGSLLTRGIVDATTTTALISAAIGAVNGVSAPQALDVLIGAAVTAPFESQVVIGATLSALVAAGTLTASAVIQNIDQANASTLLPTGPTFAVLVSMAANGPATVLSVTTEIALLISGGRYSADQALAAIFAATGGQDFAFLSAQTDVAIKSVITGLIGQGLVSAADVSRNLITAATVSHTISPHHALAVVLALTAVSDPSAISAYGNVVPPLLAGGLAVSSLTSQIATAVASGALLADTAVQLLTFAVAAAPSAQTTGVEAASGSAIAAIINAGRLSVAQLLSDLQAAVANAAPFDVADEIGLIAGTVMFLDGSLDTRPLSSELTRLVVGNAISAAGLIATIEAVVATRAGAFPQALGLLIAQAAGGAADTGLKIAIGSEFRSLTTRGLVTGSQAAGFITGAFASGMLSADTAVFVLAAQAAVPAAGGIASLVTVGSITVADVITDVRAAVTAGEITASDEANVISALINWLPQPGTITLIANELIRLVVSNALTVPAVIDDILSVAPSYQLPQSFVSLITGLSATSNLEIRIAVGGGIGALVTSGRIGAAAALTAISGLVGNGLSAEESGAVLLSLAGSGSPAVQALVGQQLASLAAPSTSQQLQAIFSTALANHSITAGQAVSVLSAISTAGFPNSPTTLGGLIGSDLNNGIVSETSLRRFIAAYNAQASDSGNWDFLKALRTAAGTADDQAARRGMSLADYIIFENSELGSYGPNAVRDPSTGRYVLSSGRAELIAAMGTYAAGPLTDIFLAYTQTLVTAPNTFGGFALPISTDAYFADLDARRVAATVATGILNALVANGDITNADIASGANAIGTSIDRTKLVYWLASLTASPALAQAAIDALLALIASGTVTAAAVIKDIGDLGMSAAGINSPVAALSPSSEVALLVALAARGDNAVLAAAAAQIGFVIAHPLDGSTVETALANVDAALQPAGALSLTRALALLINIAGNVPDTLTISVNSAIAAHVTGYVNAGLLTQGVVVSTALDYGTASVAAGIVSGSFLNAYLGTTQAISAIAAASGLTGDQAAIELFGVIKALNAVLTANNLDSIARAAARSGIEAVDNALIGLVLANRLTAAQVLADMNAAGTMSGDQKFDFMYALGINGSAATQGVVADAFAAIARQAGPASDAFMAGARSRAALDFLKVAGGSMTIVAAIADVEQFAAGNHVSTDAGLIVLQDLLWRSGKDTDRVAASSVTTEIGARLANGLFEYELAQRVAEGATPNAQVSGRVIAADATAISFADAKQLIKDTVDNLNVASHAATDANFAIDVSILQINRRSDVNLYTTIYRGSQDDLSYEGLTQAEATAANSSYSAGYAFDQALAAELRQLAVSEAPNRAQNTASVVAKLGGRLTGGSAGTDLVNMVANGTMTAQQAVDALNLLLAPVTAGLDADATRVTRNLAFGWLAVKSAQFTAGNYQLLTIVTDKDGNQVRKYVTGSDSVYATYALADGQTTKQEIEYLQSPVTSLVTLLKGSTYREDVMGGLGAISSIDNTNIATTSDRATAFKFAQTVFSELASASIGGKTVTTVAEAQAAATTASKSIDFSSASALFASGWDMLQGKSGVPGIIHDQIAANPTSLQGYTNLLQQIDATGVPLIGSKIGLPGYTSQITNELFDPGGGTVLTAISVGAKVSLVILNMAGVSDALGAAGPALKGFFNVISASSDLLGNIVTNEVKAVGSVATNVSTTLFSTFGSLVSGDIGGFTRNGEAAADALFTVSSGGFTLEAVGAVGDAGKSAAGMLVDLFGGNTSGALGNFINLGSNVLKVLQSNVYFSAAQAAIISYAKQIGEDLVSFGNTVNNFYEAIIHNPFSHPAPQTVIRDLGSVAAKGYSDPTSTSNYDDFYHGRAVDGYLSNANVFVDFNNNGVLDTGEYTTTTDAQGNYSLPDGIIGQIFVTGGTDTTTGLANTATYEAHSGVAVVSPLTTLVQVVAEANGDTSGSGLLSANAVVATAFNLRAGTDLSMLDPQAGLLQGDPIATSAFRAGVGLMNIHSLIQAVGGDAAAQSIFSTLAAVISMGSTVDLANPNSVTTLANLLAAGAGLSADATAAVASIAGATAAALEAELAGVTSPSAMLAYIAGAAIAARDAGGQALRNAAAMGTSDAYSGAISNYMQSFSTILSSSNGTALIANNTAPTIAGTVANQSLTDLQTIAPFAGVVLTDPDLGATETITLRILVNGTASDANGTLSGAGLTKIGDGLYRLLAGTPAAATAALEALIFTPAKGTSVAGSIVSTAFMIEATDGIATTSDGTTSVGVTTSGAGTGWGDVHIVTFQGQAYEFQAVGDFTFAKSTRADNPFDVQIRTAGVGDMISITKVIAAQVGGNSVRFDLDGTVRLNGVIHEALTNRNTTVRLDGGKVTRTSATSYIIDWDGGERLAVTNEGPYFNENMTLAPNAAAGSVIGLLGSNTSQSTDFQLADGTVFSRPQSDNELLGAYAESWSLDDAASMLRDNIGLPLAMNNYGGFGTPFNGDDELDLANLDPTTTTLGYSQNAEGTSGILTLQTGDHATRMTLLGQYAAAGFGVTSDGHGGTLVTYRQQDMALLGLRS